MKTMKGWISTGLAIGIFASGVAQVNAGIVVGNLSSSDSKTGCVETTKVDWGIIVGNLTGIIVGNFTGIIVGNATEQVKTDCAIIVGN